MTPTSPATSNESSRVSVDRRFRCKTCRKRFTKAEHLARHERSHSQQKPFSCQICSKQFGRQDVLVRHMRLHRTSSTQPTADSQLPSVDPESRSYAAPTIDEPDQTSLHGPSHLQENLRDIQGEPLQSNLLVPTQRLEDTGDLLELLMSDFNNSLPVSLPVIQFPQFRDRDEPNTSASVSGQGSISAHSPGHQAMDQMSKLVGNLALSLTAEIDSTGITSSFLDTCMHMFFERFIPSFPVLHKPTFSVQESSHPLLLNIMALGSLFVGAKDAILKGETLWRLAHTVVATSWQALMITRGPYDKCMGVQLLLTALLGQAYALLSKNESLRMTSQIFHGLGFYWARQCGMYDVDLDFDNSIPAHEAPEVEKNAAWKGWVAAEVQKRAILGHFILDGQISQFSGHAACGRHVTNPLLTPASDPEWEAPTADDWIGLARNEFLPHRSFREIFVSVFSTGISPLDTSMSNFSARVVLEGLQSLAADAQELDGPAVGTPSKIEISRALLKLYRDRLTTGGSSSVENMELLIRWHTICLNLATPTTTLCQRLCTAFGVQQSLHGLKLHDHPLRLEDWSRSIDGLRALLHAIAIQEIIEQLPLARSHVIHLPAAIFSAATIYSAQCMGGFPTVTVPAAIRWGDVWAEGSANGRHSSAYTNGTYKFLRGLCVPDHETTQQRNLVYDLNSLQMTLRSISSKWGVSHEMDEILQQWIALAS